VASHFQVLPKKFSATPIVISPSSIALQKIKKTSQTKQHPEISEGCD
jgi:hypothetical protein